MLQYSVSHFFLLSLPETQAFFGGGYRLGAAPEEESAYVAGEKKGGNSQQDVSTIGIEVLLTPSLHSSFAVLVSVSCLHACVKIS